jgi:hypothetical protein
MAVFFVGMAVSSAYHGVKSIQKETLMLTGNSFLLKNALLVDSVVSFLTGVALLLFSKAIAGFLGLSASWIMPVLGVVAVAYSIEIYLAARAEPVHVGIARFAAYGNLIGALGIAVLVFANLVPFTTAGKWAVAIIADAVLVLAIFQHVGLRRLAR